MKSEESYVSWYFLAFTLILWFVTFLFASEKFYKSLHFFISILIKIIPVFVAVYFLMFFFNLISDNKKIISLLTKDKSWHAWLIAVIGGIISSGPIYMWYPLLNELQKKGVSNGIIATFLYNRAVKIPLMPLMIVYFGLKFTVILTIVMIVFSLVEGYLINVIFGGVKNENSNSV